MRLTKLGYRAIPFLVVLVILGLTASLTAGQTKPDATSAEGKQSKGQAGLKPLPRGDENLEKIQEGPDFLRRRQDWFFKPRAFPIGFIPQGARARALQQMHQMLQNQGRLNLLLTPGPGLLQPGPTTSAWQSIGPQATSSVSNAPFTSGRVTALAVNPNNSNNVYLGAADGGLWVTTDAGTSWTPLTDFPPSAGIASIAVGALAVDPSSCASGATGICTTVYVGTGEDNFGAQNVFGEGVLKCAVAASVPPTATCTQDSTFHTPSPLDDTRGGPMIGALAINPKTSGSTAILLAGVRGRGTALQSGIYCSGNGGSTWTPVFGISGIVGTDAVFASDGTAFVALGFPFGDRANNGIYKSSVPVSSCAAVTDLAGTSPGGTGSKWKKQSLPAGAPAASLGRIALAISPSATGTGSNATVYAAIADSTTASSNLLGVIKTTNGGTSWTQLSGAPAFCNSQCFYDIAIAVDPADPAGNTVFAGGSAQNTLVRSTDGGTTWTEVSRATDANGDGLHVDVHALAFGKNVNVLYVGNDGGVWSSVANLTSGITTWNNLNAQLSITQFYPGISIHPSTPLFGLGGTQDNDVQQFQGPSVVWQSQEIGCDGGFTAIDPTIPSTIYGECEYLPGRAFFPAIFVAFDGQQLGNTGFLANAGISNADRGSFIPPLVMDPNNPQTLYFGTCRVWQSQDGASTWTAISPDVTSPTHPAGCSTSANGDLSTIAVAPSNSSVVYVGSGNGDVEVTSSAGTTWTSIVTSTLPARAVTQVVVDSLSAGTAYAAFSGFGTCNNSAVVCDGMGHVFKTLNGTSSAATWVDISHTPFSTTPLPDIPVNAIVIDPDGPGHNTLYVGTDIGAFFTTDGGMNWSPLGATNSLPPAEILGLALHEPSRTLRAATHGRGVWDLNLGGQAAFGITSISPFTANAGDPAITSFTVNGNGFIPGTSTIKFTINGNTTTLTPSASSATQLTAGIPAANLAAGGAAQVSVTNGATSTNSVVFTVLNPVPGITSISPATTAAGTNGLLLTVNGSNFLSGANGTLVAFNGVVLSATPVVTNSMLLTVQVPSANLATAQVINVDTFNPQPGGGPDTNATPPTLTVTKLPTTTSVTSSATSIASGGSVMLTATVGTTSHGAGATGTVQFMNGTSALSAAVTCTPTAGTSTATAFCTATLTTTLAFLTPLSAPNRIPTARVQPILIVTCVLLIILLLTLKHIPAAHRRRYAYVSLLLIAGVIAAVAGCGGGSSGGGGGAHTDSITAVYSGDATYSGSTSTAITISIH